MTAQEPAVRDDRILGFNRRLSLVIIPFLLVAFVVIVVIVVALMLIAAVRARAEFDTARPVPWLMLGGFVAILVGSGWLWYTMEIRERRT